MIKSCNLTEQDATRLAELKTATEAPTDSEVIRQAIREYHKKIFVSLPSIDGKATPARATEN